MLSDSNSRDEIATLAFTHIANLQVDERQINGEIHDGTPDVTVISGRLMIDKELAAVDSDIPLVFSRYSVCLDSSLSEVTKLVRLMVPTSILSRAGDTKESLAERQGNCRWLDEIFKHGKKESINGDPANKTCLRRTVSVAENRPYVINDLDASDRGRSVMKLPCYTCPEMSVVDWMCRPMKKVELAFLMECWVKAWPWLTIDSRREPPNMIQTLVYNAMSGTIMRMHRDNSRKNSITRMKNGQLPYDENATYAGVKNSQKYGSNVIVYTMGNSPMSMVFAYPNPLLPVDQDTKKYIEHQCLSFPLGDGYLSILDPLDDVDHTHSARWEECELHSIKSMTEDGQECVREVGGQNDDLRYRVAFVMRRLNTVAEFYTDTSTIRLNDDMREAMKGSIANNNVKGGG